VKTVEKAPEAVTAERQEAGDRLEASALERLRLPAGRFDWVVLILAIVVLGMAALLPVQIDRRHEAFDNSEVALLRQGTLAANDFVVLLTSPSASDAAGYVTELRKRSTGAFNSQLEDFAKKLEQTVQSQHVEASARVLSSGVASFDAESTIAVAVSVVQTLSNKTSDKEQVRPYRMRITLVRESGEWLVSDARFVV